MAGANNSIFRLNGTVIKKKTALKQKCMSRMCLVLQATRSV